MTYSMTRSRQDSFNKGTAALKASLLAILALILIAYTHQILAAVICGVYAHITKMEPTYYKKSGPWGYAGLIYLVAIWGLPYFFYDVFKNKAKKAGQNVDTPKNVLFWICTIFWVLMFFLASFVFFYALSEGL